LDIFIVKVMDLLTLRFISFFTTLLWWGKKSMSKVVNLVKPVLVKPVKSTVVLAEAKKTVVSGKRAVRAD
jgi:hypothetical protein